MNQKIVKVGVIDCGENTLHLTPDEAGKMIKDQIEKCIKEYSNDGCAKVRYTILVEPNATTLEYIKDNYEN